MNTLNIDIASGIVTVEGMSKSILHVCSNAKAIKDKEHNDLSFYAIIDYGTLNLSTVNTKNGNTQSVLYSVQTGTGTGFTRSASRIIDSKPEPNPEPKPNPEPEPNPEPKPQPSCEAGQWGCVTITNFGKFTHSITSRVLPQVPKVGTLTKDELFVYFIRQNDPSIPTMQDFLSVSITKVLNSTSTYISFQGFAGLGDRQIYACGDTVNSNRIDCSGVTFNSVNRTVTFNNTKLAQVIDGTKIVTVNGTLKF